jgi:hypothetical protein
MILHRKSVLGLIAAAAVLLTALSAKASITGSISGTVTDPSGAVLVGVRVTVTSVSTGIESSAVSDAKGFSRFPVLSVDTSGVAVNQSGFRPFLESGVKIDANSAIQIDIRMQLGQMTDTVTVESNAVQVETQSTQMGEVIEGDGMRRSFVGPGMNNFNLALLKDTKIKDTEELQFRAEAFNVFNHEQFDNPSGNFNNPGPNGFGFVTAARDPRIMQMALKQLF